MSRADRSAIWRGRQTLTRADLERIAEEWGVRIDDLWPSLEVERANVEDDELEETA